MTSNIVASIIASANLQRDGRVSVMEQHTDVLGTTYPNIYLAAAGADLSAALAMHAASLSNQLEQNEINANLTQVIASGGGAVVTFNYSTQMQSIAAMAQQFNKLGPWEVVLLAEFLVAMPSVDQTQVLGMTAAEVLSLQTALTAAQTALTALQEAVAPLAASLENS
jgi:hypothetical protein